jgi:hypothetical protein
MLDRLARRYFIKLRGTANDQDHRSGRCPRGHYRITSFQASVAGSEPFSKEGPEAACLGPSLVGFGCDTPDMIEADVAQIVSGINAHDVGQATRFDTDDIVSLESGRPPSQGIAAERMGCR